MNLFGEETLLGIKSCLLPSNIFIDSLRKPFGLIFCQIYVPTALFFTQVKVVWGLSNEWKEEEHLVVCLFARLLTDEREAHKTNPLLFPFPHICFGDSPQKSPALYKLSPRCELPSSAIRLIGHRFSLKKESWRTRRVLINVPKFIIVTLSENSRCIFLRSRGGVESC